MNNQTDTLETLYDIRRIMEKSSRFISLSGWSGVSAGLCALAGAYFANDLIITDKGSCPGCLTKQLIIIAAITFFSALILAILFTYFKSLKQGARIAGLPARRLIWNTSIPILAGAVLTWKLIELNLFDLLVPCSLIFYGLALINGSKYTLGEVRYLGYAEIILGLTTLWFTQNHVMLWSAGFGFLHIIYGIIMWLRYERNTQASEKE